MTDHIRAGLVARGYPADDWVLIESFDFAANPPQLAEGKQIIAAGFDFDAPPVAAECGSDLVTRPYNLEFFVIGTEALYAKNIASQIRFIAEGGDFTIPLVDVADPARPVIDALEVIHAVTRREPVPDPEPWQQFVWSTTIRVEDTYFAGIA